MAEAPALRRLAAILAADVVGYSRLMEANEERTLAALKSTRAEILDPAVARHGGRIFKVMGDGFLVEFASVVGAVRCALEVQQGMAARNINTPEDRCIRFRIGINLGDLIVDGDDFYGDGVNIASRLEGLAPHGGISCSAAVRAQIGNRLDAVFVDQGEVTVRNIAEPVHVYFIDVAEKTPRTAGTASRANKPSIAVLPFANMSNDPEQEFFSDGITEDIITDLSKVSGLFVLGRNTVFTLKGKAVDLEHAARQLGVAFIVEGSVRKAGNRVRITAQLIDGATGGHVWAERFDRELTDIFAVQDEITRKIVEELRVKLLPEEVSAIESATTGNIEAYTCYLRGRQFWYHGTMSGAVQANRLFAQAASLDPDYALAYVGMANCGATLHSVHGEPASVGDILRLADRAIALQPGLAEAHAARGRALMMGETPEAAVPDLDRALELDPNCIDAHDFLAQHYTANGAFDRAVPHYMRSLELQPLDFQGPLLLRQVLVSLGRHDEAASYARLGVKRAEAWMRLHPDVSKPLQMGALALAHLGETDRARDWLARAFSMDPGDNLGRYNAACTYATIGETERSIELLEVYLQRVTRDMQLWFLHDSDLDPIRSHPRYGALLALVQPH